MVPLRWACPEENAVYYVFCAEQIGVNVEYTSQLCITGIHISVLHNFLVYDKISGTIRSIHSIKQNFLGFPSNI